MEQILVNAIESKIDFETAIRGYSRQTKNSYIFHIKKFLEFTGKPAKLVSTNDVKKYMLHLKKSGWKATSINLAVSAIKFLYVELWKRKSFLEIKGMKKEQHIPIVISREDIEEMIKATANIKHKLLIEFLYSTGARIGEAVKLKINDLRIEGGFVLIKNGKGQKDRIISLSNRFIRRFHEYMLVRNEIGTESEYLFQNRTGHITVRTGEGIIKKAAAKAGIDYNIFPHALRASYATHMFEHGEAELNIQKLMGHADLKTTRVYIQNSPEKLKKIKSPMDYSL